jgi:hypothetical protein
MHPTRGTCDAGWAMWMAYRLFPPHNAQKGKNQTGYLLWEVCARVANERRVAVVPTMIIGDPGAEFSQKWIISDYLLGRVACWAPKKNE